jgi:ribonucleotide monophosphatase NagD (HAD superfamily)
VRDTGGRYNFLTNNSSKSVDSYIEKLGGWASRLEERFLHLDRRGFEASVLKPPYRKIYALGRLPSNGSYGRAG